MFILWILTLQTLLFLTFSKPNHNPPKPHPPPPRTGPQGLLVTHYGCEESEQETLDKHAINQVTQCKSEPQTIETTNVIATLYSNARVATLTGYKFLQRPFPKRKYIAQKSQTEIKIE